MHARMHTYIGTYVRTYMQKCHLQLYKRQLVKTAIRTTQGPKRFWYKTGGSPEKTVLVGHLDPDIDSNVGVTEGTVWTQ